MGKDSLIKSTTKKAGTKKEKKPSKKKIAAKSEAGAQVKKEAPAKAESAKAAPAPIPEPVATIEDLIFKQFSLPRPSKEPPPAARDLSQMTAPPFIDSDDPQEVARLEGLLARRFSMDEIIAVAQEPVEIAPPAQATAEAARPQQIESGTPPVAPAEESAPPLVEAPAPAPEKIQTKAEEKKEAPAASQPAAVAPYQEETRAQAAASKPERTPADPVMRAAKLGIAAVATLAVLILWASFSNSGKYFVLPKKGSIEIWQGNFSPTGKQFIAVLHGLQPVEPVKESYRRQDVYPIIFSYYVDKADALLDVSGLPDYKSITDYLQRAEKFAITGEMRTAVKTRMDNIQRLNLMYKAEIDISKGTAPSLQAAAQALKQIQRLTTDPTQLEAINQKIAAVAASQAALEAKAAADAAAQKQAGKSEPAAQREAASEK